MITKPVFVAVDLGAESGRVLGGSIYESKLDLREIHRFTNQPVRTSDGLHWDVLRLYRDILDGLAAALSSLPHEIRSVAIDSWAVDFGLLDERGVLLGNPWHYRDDRVSGMMERAFGSISAEDIYRTTGIQFLQFNTVYQLLAMLESPVLGCAQHLLMIPDLLAYWLTGEMRQEFTNVSTTQLLDARSGDWAREIIARLGIPDHLFGKVSQPGVEIGTLMPGVAVELGATDPVEVVLAASHDTASAVVAVPARDESFAYISSGTWSLVGLETPGPILTREAMASNFTNEGGFAHTNRFLKNVMGLWLLQECRNTWARQGNVWEYDDLSAIAAAELGTIAIIDPDHESFLPPGDMPERIRRYCERTGQQVPVTTAQVARCIFESLAVKYRHVLTQAATISGREIGAVHIVGGGSRNSLLCQLTADATRLPVYAGPAEATAIGNVLVQAYAAGEVASLGQMRELVRNAAEPVLYEPAGSPGLWDAVYERLLRLL